MVDIVDPNQANNPNYTIQLIPPHCNSKNIQKKR